MSRHLTMNTSIVLSLKDGGERELPLLIKFKVWPARSATLQEPSEAASVDIIDVRSNGSALPDLLDEFVTGDEGLHSSLLQYWADDQQESAEYAAEARREMLLEDARAALSQARA